MAATSPGATASSWPTANAEEKRGHAFRAMAAYVDWFESAGADGARALAMLRLTGLFDRPASAGCLAALWERPAIAGLTEPLVISSEEQRNIVLNASKTRSC